jgi:hypothetical protein
MSPLYNPNTLMDLPLTTFSLDILIKTLNHLTFLYKCNKSYQKPSKSTNKVVSERFGKTFLTDFKKEEKKNYQSFEYPETKDL